jgi:hypothetical protein
MVPEMIAGYLGGTKQDLWFVHEVGRDQQQEQTKEQVLNIDHVGSTDTTITAFAFCQQERLTDGTWNLLAIALLPSQQGQGIGKCMIQ